MMDLDANYEEMLEHVCGFCNKIFKKEMKLDKHIMIKHQLHPETSEKGEEQDIKSEDAEMMVKEESFEVKSEPEYVIDAKIRKMPQKYNNLYGFDPVNMVWICGSCGSNFHSDHGMRNHLNVTICGFGEKYDYKPKLNYKSMYMKDAGQLICCGCGSVYNSEHGMHYHLKLTTCGFGTKEKSPPKKDYTPFYKVENNIHICLVCGVNYDTIRGMHYHLQKKCGAAAQAKVYSPKLVTSKELISTPREKKNYKQFYRKEDDSTFNCLGCETVYQSSRGVHSHLNTTKCGFGDKFRSPPKTCYLKMYRREGDQFVCLGCGKSYGSNRGVHHHLNNTKCGFGEKENGPPRRNYTSLYNKEDGLYECKRCAFKVPYIHGIHRHIKSCVAGFLEELSNLAEEERKVVEKAFKDEVGDLFRAKDSGEVIEERTVFGMHDKEMFKASDVETRKPVDEQALDMLKTNDATGKLLDEMNTLSQADSIVVKMHIEDEFGEMIEANDAEIIEKPPANLIFNFMDVPLD
jgi:hypothetical protein